MHIMLFQGDLGQLTHVLVVKWFEAGIFGSSSQKTGVATGASGRCWLPEGTPTYKADAKILMRGCCLDQTLHLLRN